MVLALYVAAGVMVVGGLMAIYSGSDIIVMERGWTMVISGSVMAASGALLAGVATAVARLQNLGGEFARLSERLARQGAPAFALPPEPAAEATAAPAARRMPPPPAPIPDLMVHRDLEIAPEPLLRAPPVEPARAEAPPSPAADLNEDLFDPPAPEAAIPESNAPPATAQATAPEPEEATSAPTVVGTYNSGGNFYVMYSDGSIEAETPAGKFRFHSLDELKDFIAAGGDRPKATAPA
jgi:hypothetical protein